MKVNEFKIIFKERWKFYLVGYVIGYLVPLIIDGAPSWHYFFPIRMMAIASSLGIGSALFYGSRQLTLFQALPKIIKITMIMVTLIITTVILNSLILRLTGYDIMPLIGLKP